MDSAAVQAVANRFDDTAHLIDAAVRTQFGSLAFDGSRAGRDFVGQGDAIRFALHRLSSELAQWSRATAEIAATFRLSADRYAEADQRAAVGIG